MLACLDRATATDAGAGSVRLYHAVCALSRISMELETVRVEQAVRRLVSPLRPNQQCRVVLRAGGYCVRVRGGC